MVAPSASALGVTPARQGAVQCCPSPETPTESSVQNKLAPRHALLHFDVCPWCASSEVRSGPEPPPLRKRVHRKQCVEKASHATLVPSTPVPRVRPASQRVVQSRPPRKESPPEAGRRSRKRREGEERRAGWGRKGRGTRKSSMSRRGRKSRQIRRIMKSRKNARCRSSRRSRTRRRG